jgi:uncharacterized membrane protein YeiH
MVSEFHVPVYFDYLATFTWALSGAVVAMRKRCDIVGVFVLALLTSVGGGIVRDGLLLQRTPSVLTDPMYLPLISLATALAALFRQRIVQLPMVNHVVEVIDAIGTPAFAVIGLQYALDAHVPLPGVVLAGVAGAVGGGVLRDMVVREIPSILQAGQFFALVVVLACAVFLTLVLWVRWPSVPSAWITVAVFFIVRGLTLRYNWRTRPLVVED